ncbi:DEAD/DEAH box helicase [Methanospirillum lacunae]|uniref:DEAD/DEAH box helicase n=1 Tax=Methanospirillum lacunae TaxID=668570 RepID=A0A2V2N7S3_9EURY|nr:DEAD/DEAH box helicase [Methanospirillum lacunae]PWR72558.1 DEAD/DEAH box helicase [Methanospirillum lacunae]
MVINTSFQLLNPLIQKKLYDMQWKTLKPIQRDSINSLYNTSNNLIISASTASGKTEAAFLPILSQIIDSGSNSLSAIYIGPLKALINDQFERVEHLCNLSDIPVFRWHGDVDQSKKRKFIKNPSGILLITPESIEALFIRHSNEVQSIFNEVKFIVIDEMHSFIGTERGAHLKSLISRISQLNKNKIRIIGLSATIGDFNLAKTWMLPGNEKTIEIIQNESEEKGIDFLVRSYLLDEQGDPVYQEMNDEINVNPVVPDIINDFYGRNGLVFINTKSHLESITDESIRYLERKNLPNLFEIHHGSLSKEFRESTEKNLKEKPWITVFCSSTLEMGIDVGNISRVGQVGPCWSVNSLVQRLGRSGRGEGKSHQMVIYLSEQISEKPDIVDQIYPFFLHGLATSELLFEKWCEPPKISAPHYSTLIQQIMSVITEKGGITAENIHKILLVNGSFKNIDQKEFVALLKEMGKHDLIDQTDDNYLILGLLGEKIVKNFDFYSAFSSSVEIDVINEGHPIGSVGFSPNYKSDEFILLAGIRWRIKEVDLNQKKMWVEHSSGKKDPLFITPIIPDIHKRIRQKMKEILLSSKNPSYLTETGKMILSTARLSAKEAGLYTSNFVTNSDYTYWFTWTGSSQHNTLYTLGKYFLNLDIMDRNHIAFKIKNKTPNEIIEAYSSLIDNTPDIYDIVKKGEIMGREKYDHYLPYDLLVKSTAYKYYSDNWIDDIPVI